jgi:probable DNA metabolism protein
MYAYIYDKTFEGLLTLVFDAYSRKQFPDTILEAEEPSLFAGETYCVLTDNMRAKRVWRGLRKKLSVDACNQLFVVFLSELQGVEMLLFRYMKKAFASAVSIETNYGDPDVVQVAAIYRKVSREAERIRMFVRFQKTADNIFFAPIEPLYNVLPLTVPFFEDRFSDQQWIVYDVKRRYGLYYDLHTTVEVTFDNIDFDFATGKLNDRQAADDELWFQQLWQSYFKSISIKERTNPKLHRQNMPQRFWKFLPEKHQ